MSLVIIIVAIASGGIAYFFAKEERKYAFCAGLLGPVGWVLFLFRNKKTIRLVLNALLVVDGIALITLMVLSMLPFFN